MKKIKLICFGARKYEQHYFSSLNKYQYELTLIEDLLTQNNISLVNSHSAVMIRGNCDAKLDNLIQMKKMGIKYLLTRTVGFDHIDVDAAKQLGIKVARVPSYSPNASSELAVTLAMMLLRNTAAITNATHKGDFSVYPHYFSREVRLVTVGILGVGRIGLTTAKLFKGLGSHVLGHDINPSHEAKAMIKFTGQDEILKKADIICLHMPYSKNQNYHYVNHDFLNKMKSGAILINCGRGELVDLSAIVPAIKSGKLSGFGTDVLENEQTIFNQDFRHSSINSVMDELLSLYPKVLITPHMGSNTDEACRNMIEQSYENLYSLITSGISKNSIN